MELILLNDGELNYDDYNLKYITKNEVKILPILNITSITIMNDIKLSTNTIINLINHNINIHIINNNYHNNATITKTFISNGLLTNKQIVAYNNFKLRLIIIKEILKSAIHNMAKVLKSYNILDFNAKEIINELKEIDNYNDILIFEAKIRKNYYSYFNQIINNSDFILIKRRNKSYINSLLNLGNSILYKICIDQIIKSKLNPAIAYLHATNNRKTSLEYDLSEIYKPIIVDRAIISLINLKTITKEDFIEKEDKIILKPKAKIKVIKAIYNKINQTIKYKNIHLSYKTIMYKDLLAIKKFILNSTKHKLKLFKSRW